MNKPFADIGPKYQKKGYSVMPVDGKRAIFNGWNMLSSSLPDDELWNMWITKYGHYNISIVLGEISRTSILDLDIYLDTPEGQAIYAAIEDIIPYTPFRRIGKKAYAGFFGETTEGNWTINLINNNKIEFFSSNKQVVLPPSIHPDTGQPYRWADKDLSDVDASLLPPWKEGLFDVFMDRLKDFLPSRKDALVCGRNDRHKSIAWSMLCRGERDDHKISSELLTEDGKFSPPLFSDKSEPQMRKHTPEENALRFVKSVRKSFDRINKPKVIEADELEKIPAQKSDNKSYLLPHPTGLLDTIIRYLKADMKFHNPNWVTALSVEFLGALIGNKYQLNNSYSNQYSGFIGPSSSGKTMHLNMIRKLITSAQIEDIVPCDEFKSDVAMLTKLQSKQTWLHFIDEASWMLDNKKTKNSYYSRIKTVYSELWSRPGTLYKGRFGATDKKNEVEKSVWSPCVNLVFATTDKAFFESMESADIFQGFLNRCLIYFWDGIKAPPAQRITENEYKNMISLINFLWTRVVQSEVDSMTARKKAMTIPFEDNDCHKAHSLLLEYWADFTANLNVEESVRLATSKFPEHFNKLTCISAVSNCAADSYVSKELHPFVSKKDVTWAHNYLKAYFEGNLLHLTSGLAASRHESNVYNVLGLIKASGKLSRSDLYRKTRRLAPHYTQSIIDQLKEEEVINIVEVKAPNSDKPTIYYILK